MTSFNEQAVGAAQNHLATAGFTIDNLITGGQNKAQTWGGGILILMGIVGLVWAGVQLIRKLMADPQKQQQMLGYPAILALVLVGGGLSVGGYQLMSTVGSGGQQTIEDLGNSGGSGAIMLTTHGEQLPSSIAHGLK